MFDWFTFSAQIVNFLILVWLLKRFLYAPITKAMDQRESEIAARLEKASDELSRAEESRLLLGSKMDEIDQLREEKVEAMELEVAAKRKEMIGNVKDEVEALEKSYRESLEAEKIRMHSEFKKQMQADIIAIVKRIMEDLADRELEDQIIDKFLREAADLEESIVGKQAGAPRVIVRTSFELGSEKQGSIVESVSSMLGVKPDVSFEQSSNGVVGIELIIDGRKATWTVDDYLRKLDSRIKGAGADT